MGRPLLALVCLVVAAAVAAVAAPATAVGRVQRERAAASVAVRAQRPAWVPVRAPRPAHVIAQVRPGHVVVLRSRPFGRVVGRIGALTRFGSRHALGVVASRRGRWLAVTEAGIGGNRAVWIDAKARGLRYARTRWALDVDLSERTLTVRRNRAVVRRFSVGVGGFDSPTPTGHFSVTDKLDGPDFSSVYGCCILALSAIQSNLPAGWAGGNRIAIHGTASPSDFGQAVSAGCVHAPDTQLRYLMHVLPLGTPVVIRP